eukprot:CAMPEP_0196660660 /NCGR_PEP_ID=MMETSP1086-20130531/40817_1 /TAXON_ID=77921 /ORGANISM="Cyanoptyche  gloeocystis , Strain SAG4.97" /LENGTH=165 /DNA_ID=CAMNT_0041995195 /DNA_START=84 /DNA_END=581 /DNA_ORIENTATION=-
MSDELPMSDPSTETQRSHNAEDNSGHDAKFAMSSSNGFGGAESKQVAYSGIDPALALPSSVLFVYDALTGEKIGALFDVAPNMDASNAMTIKDLRKKIDHDLSEFLRYSKYSFLFCGVKLAKPQEDQIRAKFLGRKIDLVFEDEPRAIVKPSFFKPFLCSLSSSK